MSDRAAELALRRVVDDERRLPASELHWARVEAAIERTIRRSPRAPRRRSFLFPVLAAAAASALLVGAGLRAREQRMAANDAAPPSATAPRLLRGETLRSGSELTAATKSVDVEHAGHAHWTLLPGSKAVVRQNGPVIELELESGSVDVAVVPQPLPETFVVLAAEVRVAVHGTQFRVSRTSEHVDVTVTEGVVTVGRQGQASTLRLAAPASGTFETDGSPRSLDRSRVAEQAVSAAKRTGAGAVGRHAAPPHASPLAAEPSIAEVEAGVSRLLDVTQGCFSRYTAAEPGVRVTAHTTLHFEVQPDGRILSTTFDPPLAPNVQACADQAVRELRFAQSQRGIELIRVLELSR